MALSEVQKEMELDDRGKWFQTNNSIFDAIKKGDRMLHHPYDSYECVTEFINQAVDDPDVVAIKICPYRTGPDSPIPPALIRASEQGKQVTVLIELKARFDEEHNIEWAQKLDKAGVHVVYGIVGLKTHGKLTLVMRREGEMLRRYVHIASGNTLWRGFGTRRAVCRSRALTPKFYSGHQKRRFCRRSSLCQPLRRRSDRDSR